MLAVLGERAYNRFFSAFLDVVFTEKDAVFLASLCLNCVRLPVNYPHFEDDMALFELLQDGFGVLDPR